MAEALGIVKRGWANRTYRDANPPRTVMGDSLASRAAYVKDISRRAGEQLDRAVQDLKGVPINLDEFAAGPQQTFMRLMDKHGIQVTQSGLDFSGSSFRRAPKAQKYLQDLFVDLTTADRKDAFAVHTLKKSIDESLPEAAGQGGNLAGSAEQIALEMRREINNFLRPYSSEYSMANDILAETIEPLKDFQRLMGRYTDAFGDGAGPQAAILARRALGNNQSTGPVKATIEALDELAAKYGGQFDDDIERQISFVNSLEEVFPSARTGNSLGGELNKTAERLIKDRERGAVDMVTEKMLNTVFSNAEQKRQQKILDTMLQMLNE